MEKMVRAELKLVLEVAARVGTVEMAGTVFEVAEEGELPDIRRFTLEVTAEADMSLCAIPTLCTAAKPTPMAQAIPYRYLQV